jgi:predicted PurR-regulated permease PerM
MLQMSQTSHDPAQFRRIVVALLAIGISIVFFAMLRPYIVTVTVAAILSAMAQPLNVAVRDMRIFRGRKSGATVASTLTLLLVVGLVLVPALILIGTLVNQAVNVSQRVGPWLETHATGESLFDRAAAYLPFLERFRPIEATITQKLAEFTGRLGDWVVGQLAAVTRGAVIFLFHFFIMLYAMYFFLKEGGKFLERMVRTIPLADDQRAKIVAKFLSVTRATIKGTIVIGIVQGTLGGIGLAVAGIPNAVFWGAVMAVATLIPAVGTGLVWLPSVVILFATGHSGAAIGLAVWSLAVVGTVDNFIRPKLVGRDTAMPELLVLLSTLGGLALFGALGFLIGPLVAAIFLTVWQIFGATFADVLGPAEPPVA